MMTSGRRLVLPEQDSGTPQSHLEFTTLLRVGGFYDEEFFTQVS
jgi:hypothetical protein